MANIRKKKRARPMIPPSCETDEKRVSMRIFIEGIVVRLLNGRKSLNVLKPDIPRIDGICCIMAVTTTIKSSQFQASVK